MSRLLKHSLPTKPKKFKLHPSKHPSCSMSCAGCLFLLLPSPSCTQSTATAILRNPLVAAERFPPAGTRSPRRGAGISSARCEGFANQVISSALHHLAVYIRQLANKQALQLHIVCFLCSQQPRKLQSFTSGTVFVFTMNSAAKEK